MKSLATIFAMALLSFSILSCTSAPEKTEEIQPEHKKHLTRLLKSPIKKPSDKNLFYTLSKDFGQPQHQEFRQVAKKTNKNETEKIYTLVYDGFEINIAESSNKKSSGDFYMKKLVMHDNVLKLPYGIKIGEKAEKLTQLFGGPQRVDKNQNRIYYCDPEQKTSECVGFEISEDKVERIFWDFDH
ncbi:MAG: hypothetical protein VX583_10315 [Bdellovibrionota bacterium]|nr:hypothetical protein [Pseudobdellovibrionaceae bacterium]|tara:strand:- start:31647 stop:32201 length:555 start_codon:yes stop_codon:yes gene_type:complete